MSSGKPPTKPPAGKPFLGDDDLLSELDAWDSTFDALHTGPDPGASNDRMVTVTASELADPTSIIEVGPGDPRSLDRLGSEFDAMDDGDGLGDSDDPDAPLIEPVVEIDEPDEPVEPMSLDGALDDPAFEPGYGRRPSSVTGIETQQLDDPLEADFSDIAAGDRRSRRTMPPPLDDDDDDLPSIRVDRPGRPGTRPPSEDDVYTSASRPNPLARRGAPYDDDDDGIAPPPPPPTLPEPRRGPAIVRRSMPQPIVRDDTQITPPHGHDVSLFAEQTRIADTSEIEARASALRHAPTAIPIDDDAYDDIEIGDEPRAAAPEVGTTTAIGIAVAPSPAPVPVVDAYSAGRRTAHVLRRTDTPTRPPPTVPRPTGLGSSPVIEIETADDPAADRANRTPPPPAGEHDFSDVAAAVGADGDLEDVAGLEREPRQAPTHIELQLDDVDEPPLDAEDPADPSEEPFQGGYDDDDDDGDIEVEPPPDVSSMLDTPTMLVPALLSGADAQARRGPEAPPRQGPTALPRPAFTPMPRPPAPADLYPSRVKTPTSVPPLGRLSSTLTSLPPVTEGD